MSQDELKALLISEDFKIFKENIADDKFNECDWYVCRYSDIQDDEGYQREPRVQVLVKPYFFSVKEHRYETVEIEVRGQVNDTWYHLSAYGIAVSEIKEKIDEVEKKLVAAWKAVAVVYDRSKPK